MEERLTIRIPGPLKKDAKNRAKGLDLSLSNYIRDLILVDLKK